MEVTPSGCVSVCAGVASGMRQSLTVLSTLEVARRRPSGLNAICQTCAEWAASVLSARALIEGLCATFGVLLQLIQNAAARIARARVRFIRSYLRGYCKAQDLTTRRRGMFMGNDECGVMSDE